MKSLKTIMLITFIILATLAIGGYIFLQQPVFGLNPADTRLERISQSPNYRDGAFQNIAPTAMMREGASYIAMMSDFLNKPATNEPPRPIPTVRTSLTSLPDDTPSLVWFGHSSYLIKSKGVTILVDPVLSGSASPIGYFGRSFPGSDAYSAEDMPAIDMLVLSHDHYDHLDYQTITRLIPKVKRFYTALGVGAHLERWGVPADRIVEFDWWETQAVADSIRLTSTPARHFSGRGLTRGKTFWTSFVLDLHGYRLFLGGDSGYDEQFAKIGATYGPFDLAILECGQYGADWPSIHMFPEEVVKAGQDLKAKTVLPVHWSKFALAYHPWNEPIQRFTERARAVGLPVTTPRIGEPVVLGVAYPTEVWWNF